MITALGGGVGAAKFLKGLYPLIRSEELTVVVNTGDDIDIYGVRVSPDIDTIVYRLSDRIDTKKGWGIKGDTYNCLEMLSSMGVETWFRLGDRDFAVQFFKSALRGKGLTETDITGELCARFDLDNINIMPMSDQRVETWIETEDETLHFQEYYIRSKMEPAVRGVIFKGADSAEPAPGVAEAILESEIIIICPSNPIISIGPIIEIAGIRDALIRTNAHIVAISPLIGGRPLKGPADRLMKGLGMEVSSTQIARIYSDFLDTMVIHETDSGEKDSIKNAGISTLVTDTLMTDDRKSERLSRTVLGHLRHTY